MADSGCPLLPPLRSGRMAFQLRVGAGQARHGERDHPGYGRSSRRHRVRRRKCRGCTGDFREIASFRYRPRDAVDAAWTLARGGRRVKGLRDAACVALKAAQESGDAAASQAARATMCAGFRSLCRRAGGGSACRGTSRPNERCRSIEGAMARPARSRRCPNQCKKYR